MAMAHAVQHKSNKQWQEAANMRIAMAAVFERFKVISAVLVPLLASTPSARAQMSPAEQRGQVFVTANCSHCHAVDKVSPSPLGIAPPFRTLHLRYPIESLEEALGEGIVTGHQNMPEFKLDPGQIGDVVAYLKTLK
jgi:cytochrome c